MGPAPVRCAALLAVVVLVPAGCGGDESSDVIESAPASPTPSAAPSAPPTTTEPTTEPTTELTVVATIDTPGVDTTLVQPSLTVPSEGQLEQCGDVPILTTDVIGNVSGMSQSDPTFMAVIRSYAEEHADTFGGLWTDREAGGTIVVAFTDDPASHRDALAQRRPQPTDDDAVAPPEIVDDRPIGEWDETFDVVQVRYTEQQLMEGAGAVSRALADGGIATDGILADLQRNRLHVFLPDASEVDLAHVIGIMTAQAPADMLCLEAIPNASPPPGTPLDVIVLPGPDGYPAETVVTCAGNSFALGDLQTMVPIEDAGAPDLEAALSEFLASGVGPWPTQGWALLTQDAERATLMAVHGESIALLHLVATGSGWTFENAAMPPPCDLRLQLSEGLGDVEWVLDPGFPAPDPASTQIHVLVTERACAGAEEIGDRLLGPEVELTADAVRIAFAAIPPTGAQTCPSNPATSVIVELPEPLGERTVLDGLRVGPITDYLA